MAPRSFNQAFKAKVVEDAIRDGNWCKVARQHGIHESTVRTWLKSSDRHSEATRNNPISVRRAARRAAMTASRTTRVPTVATRPRIPLYPIVETGVVQFIDRKRIEEGFRFTRKKIIDEAKRISRENGLHEFQASVGWYNRFMERNGLKTKLLNRGVPISDQAITPAENEDQPVAEVEVSQSDQPVAEVEASQSDQPGLDQAIHPQGEPGGQSEGETGAVPEVEASHAPGETVHDQSPDDPENFQEVALKTDEFYEQLLNLQASQLARQANPWLSNSNEEEEGRLNQHSNEDDPLFDHMIGYSLEEIENMSFRDLDLTIVDSDVLPQPSSPPWCAGYKRNFLENSIG